MCCSEFPSQSARLICVERIIVCTVWQCLFVRQSCIFLRNETYKYRALLNHLLMARVFDIICGCHVCFARHGCSIILCGTFAIWRHLGINIRVMSRIWMNVFMSPLIVTASWKVMPWYIYVCLRKLMRNFTLNSPAPRPDEVLQQLPNELK